MALCIVGCASSNAESEDLLPDSLGYYTQFAQGSGGWAHIFWDQALHRYRAELFVVGGNEHICEIGGDLFEQNAQIVLQGRHDKKFPIRKDGQGRPIESCTLRLEKDGDRLTIIAEEPSGVGDHCWTHCGARAHFVGVQYDFQCRTPTVSQRDDPIGQNLHSRRPSCPATGGGE